MLRPYSGPLSDCGVSPLGGPEAGFGDHRHFDYAGRDVQLDNVIALVSARDGPANGAGGSHGYGTNDRGLLDYDPLTHLEHHCLHRLWTAATA